MPTHKLSDGFVGWPRDAVTLNGIPMPTHKLALAKGAYDGPWVLIAPNNRAVDDMGSRRPYIYNDIEEMEAEVRSAVKNNGCSTCTGTLRLRLPTIKDVTRIQSPKAMANRTMERQREAKEARGEFVPEPVIDKRKGAKPAKPKPKEEAIPAPSLTRSTKDTIAAILSPAKVVTKRPAPKTVIAASPNPTKQFGPKPVPESEVEVNTAAAKLVESSKELLSDVQTLHAKARSVSQTAMDAIEAEESKKAWDTIMAVAQAVPEPVITPEGPHPLPDAPKTLGPMLVPKRTSLPPIIPDIAIPLVFRDCQTVKGDGKARKMLTWLREDYSNGAKVQVTCGAGSWLPELHIDITHGGQDFFLVADMLPFIKQVVASALARQAQSELTVWACLLNDHGVPYYIQLAGDPVRIRKINNQIWCVALPHVWYPDVPMPQEVSDRGIGMRTTRIQDGQLAIRTHMAHPADDRVGLPEVVLAYLRAQGLPV